MRAMACWRILLALSLTAVEWASTVPQNHSAWVVYELSSGGGSGDSETRLSLNLSESLTSPAPVSSLSTFTLCLWFRVTTFLEKSTLLSYAASETIDDAIRLRASPDELRLSYMMVKSKSLDALICPLRWYPMCLVAVPDRRTMWLGGKNITVDAPTPPLPLNGHLVLGQEQDELDGGYTPSQSFLGQVTGLSMWDVALESTQLHAWSLCEPTTVDAFMSWPQLNWTLHNQTGYIKRSTSTPCSNPDDLLLFTLHLTWLEAFEYLHRIGLELAVPRSREEITFLSQRIQENQHFCSVEARTGYFAWIGVRINTANGKLEDITGQEFNMESASWSESSHTTSSSYMILDHTHQLKLRPNWAACFTARQQQSVIFRLRGLCDQEHIELAATLEAGFVLSSEGGRGIYFHGFGPLKITRKGTSSLWCLHETNPPKGTSSEVGCTFSHLLPLGTRKWTFHRDISQGKRNKTIELVLTRCTDDQYTCPDATCIDLSQRCDFKFDCKDKSDETGCATALRGEDYVETLPPNMPLDVKAYIALVSIREFDLMSMTFSVHMKVTLLWFDPWLTFLHLASLEQRKVVTAEGQEVWQPHLEVLGSVESKSAVASLTVRREAEGRASLLGYKYQGAENPLVLELDLMSTVNCQFLLQLYPWDEQKCQVAITMTNVHPDGVNVSHDSQVVQCPSLLEQYHVKECSLRKGSLTVSLRLSRRYEYHLWTTYLPTCLLQLLGYWSLYLPVDKFSERGTMSLTTLLVLISLYTETISSLPNTAYLKHIDVWFVFNICFLTLIIGIHLATCSSVSEGTAADTQSVGILFSSPGKDSDERSKYRKALTDPAFVLRVSRVVCAAVTIAFSVVYFWMIC